MKEIQIAFNTFTQVDDDVFEELSNTRWHLDSKGYAYSTKRCGQGKRVTQRIHRLIMNAPKGLSVDHINGNTLDNRKENLRVCTHAENLRNLRVNKRNKSGFRGVSWYPTSKKWRAVIKFNNKFFHLGLFESKYKAAEVYEKKAKEFYGKFYRCN